MAALLRLHFQYGQKFLLCFAACSSLLYLVFSSSGGVAGSTCPCEVCPCYCECIDRSAVRVGFAVTIRGFDGPQAGGAWTRADFVLASGARQAARDRGLELSYYISSDAADVQRFLKDLVQGELHAVVVTDESTWYTSPLLDVAAQKGIPIYIVGNVPQSLLSQLRAQIAGPESGDKAAPTPQAGCVHIGSVTEAVAAAAAEQLISAGMQRVHCINTRGENEASQAMCRAVVEASTSRGLQGTLHVASDIFVQVVLVLLEIASDGPWAAGNGTALVLLDTATYKMVKDALQLRSLLQDAHVLVLETSVQVLADVHAGKAVTALEQPHYSQGYLAVALAVQELVTGQMLTNDVSSTARFISWGEVTDADIAREVCREEGFPVCGDPGVANTSATGCPCFHRSSVKFHVLATLPTMVELRREVIAGLLDAQRDMPGTLYTWVMGQDEDFTGHFSRKVADAAIQDDNWTSILSLDTTQWFINPHLMDDMARIGRMKGNRTYWLGAFRDQSLPVDTFLAPFLADGFVGPSARGWTSLGRLARDRLRNAPGPSVLVYAPILYLPLWPQTVHSFADGFFNNSVVFADGFWELPVQGSAEAGTGVWSLFCDGWKEPGVTNGSDIAAELADPCRLLSAARLQVKPSPPALTSRPPFVQGLAKLFHQNDSSVKSASTYDAVVVAPLQADDVSLALQVLEDENVTADCGAKTRMFSMVCFSKDVQAFVYPNSLLGGQRHTGCLDPQLQLGTYITYMAAMLHQQTLGERLLSLDVSTERVVTRDNFARGQQQRLADCRIARMLGQEVETMFPVCDVHAGCGGNDTAPPCSGHGSCTYPTARMNADAGGNLSSWLGWCVCDRGFKGLFCEGEVERHATPSWLKIWLPVALGLFLSLLLSLLLCKQLRGLCVERARRQLMKTRRRPRPAEGQHVAVVFTDIEGSTALWEWNPEVMVQSLQIHYRVLRALLPKHNGYESNTEGDAFELVFHNASDALHWTMDAQLALLHPEKTPGQGKLLNHNWFHSAASYDWPPELLTHPLGAEVRGKNGSLLYRGLRVRMGIHVGVPEATYQHPNGLQRYLGKVVTLAKAIGDAPDQGGQVLLSVEAWASLDMESEHMPLVAFSMGDHVLSKELPPLGLMTVLPQALLGRVPFRPLRSPEQLSPSFFNAPASDSYLTDLPPRDSVAIMFTFVCASSAVKRNIAYSESVHMLTEFVRATLRTHNGYECEEKDGNFLLAFGDPLDAAVFSQKLQLGMLRLPWPDALMAEEAAAEVVIPCTMSRQLSLPIALDLATRVGRVEPQLVFRGLRIKTGICWSRPIRCLPHGRTGRAAYYGPLMNRAARMASTAADGETLCNADLAAAVRAAEDAERADVIFTSLGEFPLKGVSAPVELVQVSTSRLANRIYPLRKPPVNRRTSVSAASNTLSRQLSMEMVLWSPTRTRQALSRHSLDSNATSSSDDLAFDLSPMGTDVLVHVQDPGLGGRGFFGGVDPTKGSERPPRDKLWEATHIGLPTPLQEPPQGSPALWHRLDPLVSRVCQPLRWLARKANDKAKGALITVDNPASSMPGKCSEDVASSLNSFVGSEFLLISTP